MPATPSLQEPDAKKRVVLLGATGSIGESALKVLRKHRDQLQLVGVAANRNAAKLAAVAHEFGARHVALYDEQACRAARASGVFPAGTRLHCGPAGLEALAGLPECDIVLVAVVGTQGLAPALRAIEAGKTLAVASKEILVLAGKFVMAAAHQAGTRILPVDSEHNAIFQCLDGAPLRHVEKLILTSSGGSLRDLPLDKFENVTLEQALKHPNWDMGPKVTIDAATMANKGLEVIEARWLFGVEPKQIDAVVHPQSIVHSMVQFVDGSVLAQLCPPDMTFAIQHALLYPERGPSVAAPLDFTAAMQLEFRPPDLRRYPCYALARHALAAGGIMSGVFNAANEVAVEAFASGAIRFVEIPTIIEKTLESIDNVEPSSLPEVLHYDRIARQAATTFTHARHA